VTQHGRHRAGSYRLTGRDVAQVANQAGPVHGIVGERLAQHIQTSDRDNQGRTARNDRLMRGRGFERAHARAIGFDNNHIEVAAGSQQVNDFRRQAESFTAVGVSLTDQQSLPMGEESGIELGEDIGHSLLLRVESNISRRAFYLGSEDAGAGCSQYPQVRGQFIGQLKHRCRFAAPTDKSNDIAGVNLQSMGKFHED
jgi:hypothetical protein